MPFPYEVDFSEVEADLDTYVDAVFGALGSGFLVMPKGDGFVEFPVFDAGYEALKRATGGFREVTSDRVLPVVMERPICLIVLRCTLGFTPSEWAYHATASTGVEVSQGRGAGDRQGHSAGAPGACVGARGDEATADPGACGVGLSAVGGGRGRRRRAGFDPPAGQGGHEGRAEQRLPRRRSSACLIRCSYTSASWDGRLRAIGTL